MLATSVVLLVLGAAGLVLGIVQSNGVDTPLHSVFTGSGTDPGTVFITFGAVALVIGLILLTAGLYRRNH